MTRLYAAVGNQVADAPARNITGNGAAMINRPDFYVPSDADNLDEQARWVLERLQLQPVELGDMAGINRARLKPWLRGGRLPESDLEHMRLFWATTVHLFGIVNWDEQRLRLVFDSPVAPAAVAEIPWAGNTLKEFLKRHGPQGVSQLNAWVTELRSATPAPKYSRLTPVD